MHCGAFIIQWMKSIRCIKRMASFFFSKPFHLPGKQRIFRFFYWWIRRYPEAYSLELMGYPILHLDQLACIKLLGVSLGIPRLNSRFKSFDLSMSYMHLAMHPAWSFILEHSWVICFNTSLNLERDKGGTNHIRCLEEAWRPRGSRKGMHT